MMRSWLFTSVLFVAGTFQALVAEEIVIDFTHPTYARLDAEGKRLLSEYAKVYPKIKDFYENIRMDVTVVRTYNQSEEYWQSFKSKLESEGLDEVEIKDSVERSRQSEKLYELRYRQSDEYRRVDEKMNLPITPSIRAKLPPEFSQYDYLQEAEVDLLTPTMQYQLSKTDPSKQYFSLSQSRNLSKPNAEGIAIPILYFDGAPFCSESGSLGEILFQSPPLVEGKPFRVIESVRQKEIGGKQIVAIRLVSSLRLDSNPEDIHGEIRLDKNSWVIKETYNKTLGMSSGNTGWIRTSCSYDGQAAGVPLLKAYQRSIGDYDKGTDVEKPAQQVVKCTVTQLIPGLPDLSEFDVAKLVPQSVNIGNVTDDSFQGRGTD